MAWRRLVGEKAVKMSCLPAKVSHRCRHRKKVHAAPCYKCPPALSFSRRHSELGTRMSSFPPRELVARRHAARHAALRVT